MQHELDLVTPADDKARVSRVSLPIQWISLYVLVAATKVAGWMTGLSSGRLSRVRFVYWAAATILGLAIAACSWSVGLTTDGRVTEDDKTKPTVEKLDLSTSPLLGTSNVTRNPLAQGAEDEKSDSTPTESPR